MLVKLVEIVLRLLVFPPALPRIEPRIGALLCSFYSYTHTFEPKTPVIILIGCINVKIVFCYCMSMGDLPVCMFVHHVPARCPQRPEEDIRSLKLELKMVV